MSTMLTKQDGIAMLAEKRRQEILRETEADRGTGSSRPYPTRPLRSAFDGTLYAQALRLIDESRRVRSRERAATLR